MSGFVDRMAFKMDVEDGGAQGTIGLWLASDSYEGPIYLALDVQNGTGFSETGMTHAEATRLRDALTAFLGDADDTKAVMLEALRKARVAVACWSPSPYEPLQEIDAAIARAEGRDA